MKTVVNLNYLRQLYSCLLEKTDEDLDDFQINDPSQRHWLFDEIGKTFSQFGPKSKEQVMNALAFIITTPKIIDYWRYVIPHDIPLDPVPDKSAYVNGILNCLATQAPVPLISPEDVILSDEIGEFGLDTRV